jgi:hypothetical protein
MELVHANALALDLLTEHGLTQLGWVFRFDNAEKRLGVCKMATKTISASRKYILAGTVTEFTQTMLHEIAHALVGSRPVDRYGRREGAHGKVWKQKAASIGYVGGRTTAGAHGQNQLAELVENAEKYAPSYVGVSSGMLQPGVRVKASGLAGGRVITGLLLKINRTRAIVLNDTTDTPVSVPLSCLVRDNVTVPPELTVSRFRIISITDV